MVKCSLEKINSVFSEISKTSELYIPVDQEDSSSVYKKWEDGLFLSNNLKLFLQASNTDSSSLHNSLILI